MPKTMLERLLGHLHRAVFDTTPDELVAFYLDGPAGSSWVAVDENFDITFADGSTIHFDLNQYAIWEFINALQKAGMYVSRQNPDARYFAGITMLELSGKAGKPNPITLYKDIIHAIFGAYSREMRIARDQVTEGLGQLNIKTANDGFLDQWGTQFGIDRAGRTDADYRVRIPQEAFRVRVNSYGIEKAVLDETGFVISITEPWQDIFRLDDGRLSGTERFYNGQEKDTDGNDVVVSYFTVQPVSYTPIAPQDWERINVVIDRNLAAGVRRLKESFLGRFLVFDPIKGDIWAQTWDIRNSLVYANSMPRLDYDQMLSGPRVDDAGHLLVNNITLNYRSNIQSNRAVKWTFPVNGKTRSDPSNLHSSLYRNPDQPLWMGGFGLFEGAIIQVYPTTPRTWLIGGWDRDSTWDRPYDWRVSSRVLSFEDQFLAHFQSYMDGLIGQAIHHTEITAGQRWEDDSTWDENTWDKGIDAFYPTWFDSSHTFAVEQSAPHQWVMNMSLAVKTLLNVGIASYQHFGSTVANPHPVTYTMDHAPTGSGAVITKVNDHTWSVHATPNVTGTMVINLTCKDTVTGIEIKTQLTINIVS
ncbi:TPA: hypothetical protein ACODIZ_003668 [Salmonella enterica subsp. enterica serovar Newport]